jgi:phosphoribosylanthranilate isomerase
VFVKVCGTTTEEDALLAVAMGADAVGFIFAPSPRQIAPQVAGDIAKRLPAEVVTVGVFRNETRERVVEIVNALGLKGAQLHGRESPEDTQWIRRRVPMVIKAFSAGDPAVRNALDWKADILLLDAAQPGSGQIFDWRLAEDVPDGCRLMLAGGLGPDNVADAIAQAKPWGVDAVSGIESEPGHKDAPKLRAFVANAKAAAPPVYESDRDAPYDWQEDSLR